MEIKTEEISLEELNNNVVEYVLKSPHNTNPAILRQMLNSRGVSAPASEKWNIVFAISGDKNQDGIDDWWIINPFTEEEINPQDLARIMLSGTGLFAIERSDGTGPVINGKNYQIGSVLGFTISWNESFSIHYGDGYRIAEFRFENPEFAQAFTDAIMQEIS